jgi:hypothetical protein
MIPLQAAQDLTQANVIDGAEFALDLPEIRPLWGTGDEVLWPSGEALLIAGPVGVGKTTLALNLVLARIGVAEAEVLGHPIDRTEKPVLYLAADRPRQIRRNIHRMVGEGDRDLLKRLLVVYLGPPPFDLTKNPEALVALCQREGAGTVVIDSLKDLVSGLSSDLDGTGVNHAMQLTLQSVEVLALHHLTKKKRGRGSQLEDVYGSALLTAGMGSVLIMDGHAGNPVVRLHHVKIPVEQVGPISCRQTPSGLFVVHRYAGLHDLLVEEGELTAPKAARIVFHTDEPEPAKVEQMRRQLDRLVDQGQATVIPGRRGGPGGTEATQYRAVLAA